MLEVANCVMTKRLDSKAYLEFEVFCKNERFIK